MLLIDIYFGGTNFDWSAKPGIQMSMNINYTLYTIVHGDIYKNLCNLINIF